MLLKFLVPGAPAYPAAGRRAAIIKATPIAMAISPAIGLMKMVCGLATSHAKKSERSHDRIGREECDAANGKGDNAEHDKN